MVTKHGPYVALYVYISMPLLEVDKTGYLSVAACTMYIEHLPELVYLFYLPLLKTAKVMEATI